MLVRRKKEKRNTVFLDTTQLECSRKIHTLDIVKEPTESVRRTADEVGIEPTAPPQAPKIARRTRPLPTVLSKQDFNFRFLLATQVYIPKVALVLLRECQEDIELFGLEYARQKWARFIGVKKEE